MKHTHGIKLANGLALVNMDVQGCLGTADHLPLSVSFLAIWVLIS